MKVFLSSTYDDLVDYRKAAHDALEQLGLQVVWMEAFGARPVESTKACLDEVEECELFVGIYAYRYGYIPDGEGGSITEEEFNHAQKLGKPVFGFIIKDDFPWQPKNIEHDKKAELNSLLAKVKKQPVEFFTTPDNLASGISSSVGHYLLSKLEKQAQGEGRKLFEKLKHYVDSSTKKRIEDDLSSFLARLKKAMTLAKLHGADAFAELVEFSLIRASLLTQTRKLPEEYYLLKAMLDGIIETEESVENIGELGRRALAYAVLVSSDASLELKNKFARRAIELSRHSGAEWEQSKNQSRIGFLLINSIPLMGVEAFKLAIDTIKKAKKISYVEEDIFQTTIKEFEKAYKCNPIVVKDILDDFVNFVGGNGRFALMLDLAKALYPTEKTLALKIFSKSHLELSENNERPKIPDYRKDEYERRAKRDKEKFIENAFLLGENQLAENIIKETNFYFETERFLSAIKSIKSGNFEQAINNSTSSAIRVEVIIKLFELDRPSEAIKLLTPADYDIIDDYIESIIKHSLVDELISSISKQKEQDDFFSYLYEKAILKLKIALARELHSKNLEDSRKLINELAEDKEYEPFKFPYWGEAALIMEFGIRWGQQKTNELVGLCIDNFQEQLKEAEKISKKSATISEKPANGMQIGDFKDQLKEFSEVMSLQSNNFVYAWFSYEKFRNELLQRLASDRKLAPDIVGGKNYIENKDWTSFERWITNIDFSKTTWEFDDGLVGIVRDLVLKNKLDLAKKISANLGRGLKWQVDTWISAFPMLTELDPYNLDGFDDPDHIFLIRAEAISKHSPSIAVAYVRLYCEYNVKARWLDDMLGWDLCNLALFLYKLNDNAGAHKYFVLGIQHWFQYAMETEETWNEIVEKLVEVNFEVQFSIVQDILLWNSNRNIHDVVRTIQMFSMFLVKNLEYEHVVEVLKAMKRSRDWHLDDIVV